MSNRRSTRTIRRRWVSVNDCIDILRKAGYTCHGTDQVTGESYLFATPDGGVVSFDKDELVREAELWSPQPLLLTVHGALSGFDDAPFSSALVEDAAAAAGINLDDLILEITQNTETSTYALDA